MKKIIFILFFMCLSPLVNASKATKIADLATESIAFKKLIIPLKLKNINRQEAKILLQAATILKKSNDCGTALKVIKKAFKKGAKDNFVNWLQYTQLAYCHRSYRAASKAAWLTLQKAHNRTQKNTSYILLGHILEHRSDWKKDWNYAALEAWNDAFKFKKTLMLEKRRFLLEKKILLKEQKKQTLLLTHSYPKADRKNPALCFDFNKSVKKLDFVDYIQISPTFKTTFKAEYHNLCIYGANYGTTYQIKFRQGLGNTDYALKKDKTIEIKTGHRNTALWFKNNHYLLAKGSQSGIPLYSINAKKVRLKLYRIDERNVLTQFVQDYFKQNLSSYELDSISNKHGEMVWQGQVEIAENSDKQQISALKIPQNITEKAGLYILSAKKTKGNNRWTGLATQWLVISDIGLTSYQGEKGLTVIARSLNTAQPLVDIPLTLYAKNNSVLATATTDLEGVAFFNDNLLQGKGGKRARQISAIEQQALSFLSLTKAAFDLSDRGVGGRLSKNSMDAFIYSERGVYRPAESINLVALLRNQLAEAILQFPLTMRLYNPANQVVIEKVIKPQQDGAYLINIPLSKQARTGRWRFALFTDADSANELGTYSFLVEAIKPPRIASTMIADTVLIPNKVSNAHFDAQYLFGAPVIDRPVTARLILEADPQPFPDYKEYQFKIVDEKVPTKNLPLEKVITDKNGIANFKLKIPSQPETRQPLKARLKASVLDTDGQTSNSTVTIKVRHLEHYIGIKTNFASKHLAINSLADFQVVYLDKAGKPQAKENLSWQLLEEKIDYQWFYKDGKWQYERSVQHIEVATGELKIDQTGLQDLQTNVDQGRYRLVISDPQSKLQSSLSFNAGRALYSQDDTPDTIELSLEKTAYKIGEKALLHIEAPFNGTATLVVASDQIHYIKHFDLSTETLIEVPINKNWGAGAYALVTGYKPQQGGDRQIKRAIGVIWIKQDQSQHELNISMTLPPEVRPRQQIKIPLIIKGDQPNQKINLSLSAVDEGVLSLTRFKSPDPLKYYFGKRLLNVKMRDHYADLIQDPNARDVLMREGAGSSGHRGMPDTNIKVVSLFSGILTTDEKGQIQVPIQLPDYNGKLRLMAVAWTKDSLGAQAKQLLVRDPLIVASSLARFLAVKDKSNLNLLIINPAAPEGDYQVKLSSNSLLKLPKTAQKITLKRNQQQKLDFPINTHGHLGEAILDLEITGPENYLYKKKLNIFIRGDILPTIEQQFKKLEPNETLTLSQTIMKGFYQDTGKITATLSASPQLDVPALLDKLDRYPHGCLEQTTSRAFPLLFVNELSRRWDYKQDPKLHKRIQDAIYHILQKQRSEGSFGLWSRSSHSEFWLTSYSIDFLLTAKEKGYEVPDFFIEQSLQWLTGKIANPAASKAKDFPNFAYAHYVLTKAGKVKPEETRYLFDTFLNKMPTALSVAHLGASFALQGDTKRAKKAFKKVMNMIRPPYFYGDYGSGIRDLAATIYLVYEAGSQYGNNAELLFNLSRAVKNKRYLSTQEQAWMVLASLSVENNQQMKLKLNNETEFSTNKTVVIRTKLTNQQNKTIQNMGDKAIWVNLNLQGTPIAMPKNKDHYFKIKRTWFNEKGKKIDLKNIKQGQLIFAVVEVESKSSLAHRAILMDLLPAGFEIENSKLVDSERLADYKWLPKLDYPTYSESLDDRFIAAFNFSTSDYRYKKRAKKRFAYLLRATTLGEYNRPASEVEDMYMPKFRARSGMEKVRIVR